MTTEDPYNRIVADRLAMMILNNQEQASLVRAIAASTVVSLDLRTPANPDAPHDSTYAAARAFGIAWTGGTTARYAAAVGNRLCDALSGSLADIRAGLADDSSRAILDTLTAPLMLGSDELQRFLGERFLPVPEDLLELRTS